MVARLRATGSATSELRAGVRVISHRWYWKKCPRAEHCCRKENGVLPAVHPWCPRCLICRCPAEEGPPFYFLALSKAEGVLPHKTRSSRIPHTYRLEQMPKRPHSHRVADQAVNRVESIFVNCGWACDRIQHDYGEDLLIQTALKDEVDPHRIFVQVKRTTDIQRFLNT